jgi:hypothetical protein
MRLSSAPRIKAYQAAAGLGPSSEDGFIFDQIGLPASCPVYPQQATSFDHLVGAYQERWRDSEAKRFGGSHVDGEVEMRGALER